MHAKVFKKRIVAFVLAASMLMPTSVLADEIDDAVDSAIADESGDLVNDENSEFTGIETKDPSECDQEYYKYILDYYNIDDSTLTYEQYLAANGSVSETPSYEFNAYEAYEKADHYDGMKPYGIKVNTLPKEVYGSNNPQVKVDDSASALYTDETGFVDLAVEVEQAGYYYLSLSYYNITSKNSNIQRAIFVDGKLPYSELTNVQFNRMWINNENSYVKNDDGTVALDEKGFTEWKSDNQGNDLKASQVEVHDWQKSFLFDSQGYYNGELAIYLEEGEHIITLYSITEEMVVYSLGLEYVKSAPSYEEYLSKTASLKNESGNFTCTIQGEDAVLKSSQMLYPQQDQSSAAVSPYSSKLMLNNSIGGNSWRIVGDWLEWEFEVDKDGYYNIDLLVKQNFTKGVYVSRKIMIDGVVPFEEMNEYGYSYDSTWYKDTLSDKDGNAYKFYLTEGKHTLRMSVVLGDFGDIVGKVSDVTDDLNKIYREVICLTGRSPDVWRDYEIEEFLPGLTEELQDAYDQLDVIIEEFEALVGKGSDKERALTTMRTQVGDLIEDNEYFVKVVNDYRSNVRACGTWIADVIGQPLAVDSIYITSCEVDAPKVHNNFWIKFIHELKRLFYSFIVNYDIVGDVSDPNEESKTLTLWVGTGRDQSNVIKSMISEEFTAETGINVTVMLVDINTLLQATLAGQGPDVAIEVNYDLPVNYGLRGAVYDLANFDDLDEVLQRYDDSAYEAYKYGDSVFALPCNQTFLVMFYRKDILQELGLELPNTWDEMITALTVMSQNNMDLGMLPGEEVFLMFLLQNGGEYYNEDGSACRLDEEVAINSFTNYCKWYTDYGVDKTTNVEERFRTGESPIIIYNFGYYNTLQVSAPDINGLWGVTQVPGTERIATEKVYDGNGELIADIGETYIDHTIASVGNACVIMSACEDKESAWEFLKWWTDADTQVMYSHEMESINGASAKVPTANTEAFQQIGYPVAFTETINSQRATIRGIRQIAGSYFTFRYINNAYYAITADSDSSTPREELTDRITYINDEIEYKREELGLND